MPPNFDTPRLAEAVERLSAHEIDALPFGSIRLESQNNVTFYSEAERRLSGLPFSAIGKNFFADIAPCLDQPNFRGRIDQALAAGRLDIAVGHVGVYADRDKEVDIRVQSAGGGGCWIFIRAVE